MNFARRMLIYIFVAASATIFGIWLGRGMARPHPIPQDSGSVHYRGAWLPK